MVKKSGQSKIGEPVVEEPKESTVTLSVRLSERERELLQKAADLRGWSATALLRTAALERAAHIVNTSTQTRIDFRGQAHSVATRLIGHYQVWDLDRDLGRVQRTIVDAVLDQNENLGGEGVEVEPHPMTLDELSDLQRTVKFGGAEFLNMIVEACHSVSAPGRNDLPEPIDPGSPVE